MIRRTQFAARTCERSNRTYPAAYYGATMPEGEQYLIDKEAWSQRELLEVICRRYFVLGNQGLLELSWHVNGRDGRNPSACLRSLNRHLKKLSLIGVLDEGDPPVLSIGRLPLLPMVMPSWQQALVWALVSGFVTIAGSLWATHLDPSSTTLGASVIQSALLTFTLPVIGSVLLASYARLLLAARFEIDAGHLIPLALPVLSPVWPFGIVATLGQLRPDLQPVPDRRSLGFIELVVPTVLFFCGTVLTLVGLSLTANQPPAYEATPIILDTNFLIETLISMGFGTDLALKLQWIHPTGLAGIGLSIVGWGLLLPIPGFPGDRILHALIGPIEMTHERNQTSLFISTLAFMLLIFISTEYWPWLLVVAIAAWRRFSPEQTPSPFVVDEYAGLDEASMRQIGALLLAILVIGYPGLEPSHELEGWDEGLSTDTWPAFMGFEDGQAEVELTLEPAGIMPVSGWLQMRVEGATTGSWQIYSECLDDRGVCRFDDVTQASPGSITINLARNQMEASEQTFRLLILIDVADHVTEHAIVFQPSGMTSSVDPLWVMVEDTDTPRICIELLVVEGDYVNLSNHNPFWSFENETSLGPGTHDLCMRGHQGAIQSLSMQDDQFRRIGPTITLSRASISNDILFMAVEETQPSLQVSDGEWRIPEWFESDFEYAITRGESGSAFCPPTDVIAGVNASGDWDRDLADRSAILMPAGDVGNGTLRFSESGWLALCNDTTILASYRVTEGPDVMVDPGTLASRLPNGEFSIVNRDNASMPINLDWTGDAVAWDNWEAWAPSEVDAMSSATANASVHGSPLAWWAAWVTADEDGITLHFAARTMEGA